VAHLCLATREKKFETVDEAKTEEVEGKAKRALGPGMIKFHLVTDEWVLANPLWEGTGKGIFAGHQAPRDVETFAGCIMYLLTDFVGCGRSVVADMEHTYVRRSGPFRDTLGSPDGASFEDLQDVFLQKRPNALALLMRHLLDHAREDAGLSTDPLHTNSFWTFRLMEPIKEIWAEWRTLPDFRMKWPPVQDCADSNEEEEAEEKSRWNPDDRDEDDGIC